MSDKKEIELINTLVQVTGNDFNTAMGEFYSRIEYIIASHGPQTWEAILFILQFKAFFDVLVGFLLLAAAWVFYIFYRKCVKKIAEVQSNAKSYIFIGDIPWFWGAVLSTVLSIGSIGFAIFGKIFVLYNWLTLWDPELALMYKILTTIINI